jgi:hypothetical protein
MSRVYSQPAVTPVPSQSYRPGFLVAGLVCLAVAITVSLAAIVQGLGSSDFYGILAGAMVLGGAWALSLLVSRANEPRMNWLNPLYGLGLWYFIHFGVMAVYNYLDTSPRFLVPVQGLLLTGVWAAVLGYLSLAAGYFLTPVRDLVPTSAAWRLEWLTVALDRTIQRRLLLTVCLGLGWLPRLYLILTGSYHFGGGFGGYVEVNNPFAATQALLEHFASLALVVAAVGAWEKGRHRGRVVFWGILLVEVGWGFMTGSKQYVFAPLVWAFGAWYGLRGWRSARRSLLYLGLVVLFILLIFPLLNRYRNIPWRVTDPVSAWKQAISQTPTSVPDLWSSGTDAVAQRLGGIVPLSLVIRYTPSSWDFQYGRTFVSALFALVPRFIFPNKPPAFNQGAFGRAYYLQAPDDFYTSNTPTVPGELYLNFGWPGIVLGMMVYGAILRVIWEWYKGTGQSAGALLILLIAWYDLLLIDGLFSDYIAGLPRQIIIVVAVFWVVVQATRPTKDAKLRPNARHQV